jgi:RNA polymerase sigma factor (sigma-70 family)
MASFSGVSDSELLLSVKNGNQAAYNEIYERYWKKLYNETFKRLKDPARVEELVQDVFIDLWVSRARKNIVDLEKYLVVAVRYAVFTNYRRTKSIPNFEEPLEHLLLSDLQADSLVNVKEIKGCIAIWLSMQPERRAEIFRMRYMEDISTKEISLVLGISRKTVQNQLITSFKSLRDFLKKLMLLLTLT